MNALYLWACSKLRFVNLYVKKKEYTCRLLALSKCKKMGIIFLIADVKVTSDN